MPEEPEDVVDVPEAAAVPANWPTNGASPAEALQAQVARDLANDPLAEVCFRAETARARGNACFGEGDVEGAVAEWTASIRLSGGHARCAESKALALANRSLARLSEWADVRGAVADARAAVAAHPPYLKGHVRHAAALRAALGDGAREVWHALAAADAQKLNKEEALELKRHKALAARRRTAYDKAVAELCASDFDERVEKALEAAPPRAAVVQGGSELALPARCCAIVGACLDWRLASRPVDAIHYARRAKSWRGVCAGARRTLDAGVLAPLVGAELDWAFLAGAPAKLVEDRRHLTGGDPLLLAAGLTRCPRLSTLHVRGAQAFPLDAALRVCGHRLTTLSLGGVSAPCGFWLRALAGCPLLYAVAGALNASSDEFCRALGKHCARLKSVRLEGATDLEAGAGALAKGCPALRDVSFSRAPRLSADALEPLFGLGRLERLVLVTCPNVGDALLEDLDELSEDRWLPLRRLELAGTRCTAAKVAEVEAALAERSTTVEIALRDSVVAEASN
ncbi:unnamed protein product [Pelagomonas calceolata]|uniref:Uncharacterized protein n=1 Tax=Pelagomonas calceolata TaxID=35677 RepID=A0A8J2WGB7_9STRA|nr:unnamed protein product [Pelagomonas calceolata]